MEKLYGSDQTPGFKTIYNEVKKHRGICEEILYPEFVRFDFNLLGRAGQVSSAAALYMSCSLIHGCVDPNAECRRRGCDNVICYCKEGYLPSHDFTTCEKVVTLGQPCISRCSGFHTMCDQTTHVCVCENGYTASLDNKNCVLNGKALLGETCSNGSCALSDEQTCQGGQCTCIFGKRPATTAELQAYPETELQCRNNEYSLDVCSASSFLEFVRFDFNLLGRAGQISSAAALYMSCSVIHGCVDPNAECRRRGCDNLICYCREGFLPSYDFTTCERVVTLGQSCISRCSGFHTMCDQTTHVCVCENGYTASLDNKNCVLNGKALLGETCNTGSCALSGEQTCQGGQCTCIFGKRPATTAELQAYPETELQCRNNEYSLDVCSASSFLEFVRFDFNLLGRAVQISSAAALYMSCSVIHGCVDPNAECRRRGCDNLICYCREGFLPSYDFTICETVVTLGQSCISRCSGFHTMCDQTTHVCVCENGYTASLDNKNCVLNGKALLGETCNTGSCALSGEQTCQGGQCTCIFGKRPATTAELQAYPETELQCRDNDYSLVENVTGIKSL
ncbi:fibrillin-2-like [Liolophura sinensis]|uniref:fibrillin-2-like n=1 Tax=Liolophura sinensis TaxID=3198878 RepID=UPI00315874AA